MIAQRWQQNRALQTQLAEQRVDLAVDIGVRDIPGLHHQMQVRLTAPLDRACLEFTQIVARPITEQPNQKGSIARQAARIQIGTVVQLLDGLEDALARIHPHQRFVVDDP